MSYCQSNIFYNYKFLVYILKIKYRSVVDELRLGRRVEPKFYKSVTIMYSDIVGFTSLCSESQPMEVVNLLNGMFKAFDHVISQHKAYKVETIGLNYILFVNFLNFIINQIYKNSF